MDTGTESDAELRRRVVEAVRSGLMTGREVIEELGISSGVLGGWCRSEDARRAREAARPAASSFARVSVVGRPGTAVATVLLRGGRRVRVAEGFDAGEVARLVRALETC